MQVISWSSQKKQIYLQNLIACYKQKPHGSDAPRNPCEEEERIYPSAEKYLLPSVILWDPFMQYPDVFVDRLCFGAGSERNENLHKNVRHIIVRSRLGVESALGLFTIFFYPWNEKREQKYPKGVITPITPQNGSRIISPSQECFYLTGITFTFRRSTYHFRFRRCHSVARTFPCEHFVILTVHFTSIMSLS